MTTWQLFVATFFSLDFFFSVLVVWGLALAMAVILLALPNVSRYLEKKTGRAGFSNEEFFGIKKIVYFAMGIMTIFCMFASSTAGLFYFPIFLETSIKWLGASYLLVAVSEFRRVSFKEFLGFVVPFYAWEQRKQKEREKQPIKLTVKEAAKKLLLVLVIVAIVSIVLSSTFS